MNQREQFDAWWCTQKITAFYGRLNIAWAAWQAADAAKDAEAAELRAKYERLTTLFHNAFAERNALCDRIDVLEAKLAKCRELINTIELWKTIGPLTPPVNKWTQYQAAKEACGL